LHADSAGYLVVREFLGKSPDGESVKLSFLFYERKQTLAEIGKEIVFAYGCVSHVKSDVFGMEHKYTDDLFLKTRHLRRLGIVGIHPVGDTRRDPYKLLGLALFFVICVFTDDLFNVVLYALRIELQCFCGL